MTPLSRILFPALLAATAAVYAGEIEDPYHPASNLYLTTRLKTAAPGQWIRRYAPGNTAYTTVVVEKTGDSVTIQHIKTHRGGVRRNDRFVIALAYLDANAIDPDAEGAKDATVSRNGVERRTRAVTAPVGDAEGVFHFDDAIPVTGLLCVEIRPPGQGTIFLWTDAYGSEPDDLVAGVGPGSETTLE